MQTSEISVYLPNELAAKFRRLALEQGRSVSGLAVEAVRSKLADKQEAGSGAILRQLGHLEARIDVAVREGVEIKETLLWFVRVWLEHNPPIEEDLEESAAASAAERFERFLGYIAESLSSGRSVAPVKPPTTREDINGATP